MIVNPNRTEEENLLDHINLLAEFPLSFDDIQFGNMTPIFTLPDRIEKSDLDKVDYQRKNTEIEVLTKPSSKRWRGTTAIRPYRRLHLAVQWYKIESLFPKIDNRFMITKDPWSSSGSEAKDFFLSALPFAVFKPESIDIEVLELNQRRYNLDTGKIRIAAKASSLLYTGVFEIDVVYQPKSFLPSVLSGFSGFK